MRHKTGYRKLNLPTDQRIALLRSLSKAMIENHSITTTITRAKELTKFFNRIITKAKKDDVAHRRDVFKVLPDRMMVKKFFSMVSILPNRDGSYLRTTMLGRRRGDGVVTAKIEFVDASSLVEKAKKDSKKESKKPKKIVAKKK